MRRAGSRYMRQRLALRTNPLAANLPLNREDARGVVELLGDVLADALERTAATADRRLRFVADLTSGQMRRQRLAFRLLLRRRRRFGRLRALELAGHRIEIGVDRLPEQTGLLYSAVNASAFAANRSRLRTALSCVSLSMVACL
ncbi:MAG: hypothetical protein AMXMBFR52_22660 [Burkholderiales bacterium]